MAFTIGSTDLCTASRDSGRGGVVHGVERPAGLGRDGDGDVLGGPGYLRGVLEHDDAFGDTARSLASGRRDGVGECCRRPWRHRHRRRGQGWHHRIRLGLRLAHRFDLWSQPRTSAGVSDGTGTYYDVAVAPGSAFSSLTITVCDPRLGQLTRLVHRQLVGGFLGPEHGQAVAWWPR